MWGRWSNEYLTNLRECDRNKNKQGKRIAKGYVAISHDKYKPSSQWKFGKVSKLLMGQDGHTRRVELEAANKKRDHKMLQRPLKLLCSLELADEMEAKEKKAVKDAEVTDTGEVEEHQQEAVEQARDRLRRAAAKDSDWCLRQLEDQIGGECCETCT